MRLIKPKKGIAVLVAVVAVGVGAYGAYGYWTTSGSGTGTALTGTATGQVDLHVQVPAAIVPGGTRTVTFSYDNAGDTDLWIGNIVLNSVTSEDTACQAVLDSTLPLKQFHMPGVVTNTVAPRSQRSDRSSGDRVAQLGQHANRPERVPGQDAHASHLEQLGQLQGLRGAVRAAPRRSRDPTRRQRRAMTWENRR